MVGRPDSWLILEYESESDALSSDPVERRHPHQARDGEQRA